MVANPIGSLFSYIWKWTKLFVKDAARKEFIAIKILSILYLGGATSLMPFLTIQARSLGITEQEIGLILSVMPIIGIFLPALSGMFADKVGNFKAYLSGLLVISCIISYGILYIPVGRIEKELPESMNLTLTCSSSGKSINLEQTCQFRNETNIKLILSECQSNCASSVRDEWCGATENCSSIRKLSINSYVDLETFNGSLTIQNKCFAEETVSDDCFLNCTITIETAILCASNKTIIDINPSLTLVAYAGIRLLLMIFTSAIGPMFEGSVMSLVKEHKGNIGFQRVYLNIGMFIMTPLSGLLMDTFSKNGQTNYSPAVFMYIGFNIACATLFLFVNLEFKKPAKQVFKNARKLLTNWEIDWMLFVFFFSGGAFGFLETFLFWLLEDLGADKTLMGTTITVGAASAIPFMIISESIIKKFGHPTTITFALSVYFIRLFGYTIISNPWHGMIFEALECLTFGLLGTTLASYICVISKPDNIVTLQGLSSSVFGIGHGTANLVGGFLIHNVGLNNGFRIMAVAYAIASFIYFLASLRFKNRNLSKSS